MDREKARNAAASSGMFRLATRATWTCCCPAHAQAAAGRMASSSSSPANTVRPRRGIVSGCLTPARL